MAKFRDWSVAAKLTIAAVVGVLLTIGLCSAGTKFEGHGTPLQDFAAQAGLVVLMVSVVLLLAGIVAFFVGLISGPRK